MCLYEKLWVLFTATFLQIQLHHVMCWPLTQKPPLTYSDLVKSVAYKLVLFFYIP